MKTLVAKREKKVKKLGDFSVDCEECSANDKDVALKTKIKQFVNKLPIDTLFDFYEIAYCEG